MTSADRHRHSTAAGQQLPGRQHRPALHASASRVLIPGLTITKTASTASGGAGPAVIGYTITITDTGQTPYTGATVTDSLAGVLDDADL